MFIRGGELREINDRELVKCLRVKTAYQMRQLLEGIHARFTLPLISEETRRSPSPVDSDTDMLSLVDLKSRHEGRAQAVIAAKERQSRARAGSAGRERILRDTVFLWVNIADGHAHELLDYHADETQTRLRESKLLQISLPARSTDPTEAGENRVQKFAV